MQNEKKTVNADAAYLAIENRALIGWTHLTSARWSVREKYVILFHFSWVHLYSPVDAEDGRP